MKKSIIKVKSLKIPSRVSGETYYWGETLNGKPHGNGYSETFETSKLRKKIFKEISKKYKKAYLKSSTKKKEGYIIIEKYVGEWKNGMMHGYGEFIEYYEPEHVINKDGTAKPFMKYRGNFIKGKKEGKFDVYEHWDGDDEKPSDWKKRNFKNDLFK